MSRHVTSCHVTSCHLQSSSFWPFPLVQRSQRRRCLSRWDHFQSDGWPLLQKAGGLPPGDRGRTRSSDTRGNSSIAAAANERLRPQTVACSREAAHADASSGSGRPSHACHSIDSQIAATPEEEDHVAGLVPRQHAAVREPPASLAGGPAEEQLRTPSMHACE